ncbi:MAG TPA: hypothetical protein VHL09_04420 [Dehalococcoidia bacterium]|nr:hypothetical protein [Dehalococcoidia bacterium]
MIRAGQEFDDIVLALAERAVEVMTGQDLRDTLEAIEAANVSLSSTWGLVAASITTLIQNELSRRGL